MIKYLILDVDGTMTDSKIYISSEGEIFKAFNIKDGYGIAQILKENGIEAIVITGRESEIVEKRCAELGISKVYQNVSNKKEILLNIIDESELDRCAYMGDDLPDLECIKIIKNAGGVSACPSDAIDEIKKHSVFISSKKAGDGCVRELIDWIVSQNKCN